MFSTFENSYLNIGQTPRPRDLRNLETRRPGATKGPRVSKSRRSHWSRRLTDLDYSNHNYVSNIVRILKASMSASASPSPNRRRQLRGLRVAPPGWGTDSESETDTDVPPPDVLATFLRDVNVEQAAATAPPPPEQLVQLAQLPPPPSRFAVPMSDKAVEEAKQAAIPKKTKKDTEWCAKIWRDWSGQRNTSASVEQVPDIVNMGIVQLQRWMSRFVLEIRKKDGTPYPPESVYHIVCGIMRFVRLNGKPEVDFF